MSLLPNSARASARTATRLFLLFRAGGQRFALDARQIAQVLPMLPLRPVARAPAWVAGIFAHRGQVVPVIDIGALAFDQAATARTSTRLVLVHYPVPGGPSDALLGLVLEQATHTLRCDPHEFRAYGLATPEAPYLGPVREDAEGLLQWVGIHDLLDDTARALLYAPALAEGFREREG